MFRHSYFTQSSALDNVLSHDALRRVVPSAFAEAPRVHLRALQLPAHHRRHFPLGRAWLGSGRGLPVRRQGRIQKGFQSHMIRFAQLSDLRDRPHVEVRPEIAYINSHDKSRAARLEAGLLRFACANGLIVSDGSVAGLRFKHFGVGTGELDDAVIQITAKAPALFEAIEQWRARKLSETEQREFARRAIDIRWPAKSPSWTP
ncbi:DUF945 domain-containing protein (plasmid) [Termitidicoccus mucosus]|uniref:DUF932 domain-containing protein n=2 Tax=Termitidicoccus mucosus TaxID=1184151 RepID=UPI0031831F47